VFASTLGRLQGEIFMTNKTVNELTDRYLNRKIANNQTKQNKQKSIFDTDKLDAIDSLSNQWMHVLVTLADSDDNNTTLRKDWHDDRYDIAPRLQNHFGKDMGLRHFTLKMNGKAYQLVISQSVGIIYNTGYEDSKYDEQTLIFAPISKTNAELFFWGDRNNFMEWNHIEDVPEENGIQLSNLNNTEFRNYVTFPTITWKDKKGVERNWNVIDRLKKMSLSALYIAKSKKLGNYKSNQNSTAQSARRLNKGKDYHLEIESGYRDDYIDKKVKIVEAYKLAVSFGYKSTIGAFKKMLSVKKEVVFEGKYSRYRCSVISSDNLLIGNYPTLNNIYTDLNSDEEKENLNKDVYSIYTGLVTEATPQIVNNEKPPEDEPIYQDYYMLCLKIFNNSESAYHEDEDWLIHYDFLKSYR
jgi:hypothetical protein